MKRIILFILIIGVVAWNLLVKAQEQTVQSQAAAPFVYQDEGKRDPFLSLVDSEGNIVLYDNELILSDLKLEGIMLSANPSESVAIINGRIVKFKDRIGAFVIENILKDRVVLKKGQETVELLLKKE